LTLLLNALRGSRGGKMKVSFNVLYAQIEAKRKADPRSSPSRDNHSFKDILALMKEIEKDIESAGWSVPEYYDQVKTMPL
jgi:hypothetical protein